jgi:hypothetical protein
LPAAALVDPATRQASLALAGLAVSAALGPGIADGEDGSGLSGVVRLIWTAAMAVCVLPTVAVALLGETARVRALAWYAGATGFAAAAAPWLIRAALGLPRAQSYNSTELRFALIFFLSGVISGSLYWLLAGRDAGQQRATR